MTWNKVELRDYAIHRAMRVLPIDWCSALGDRIGRGQPGRLSRPEAEARGRAAMALLRPDLATAARIEASTQTLWGNIGRTFGEFAVLPDMVAQGRAVLSDAALWNRIVADDRALIVAFVHLGNWEVTGAQLACHTAFRTGERTAYGVIMPPANRAHAAIAARQRRFMPVTLLPMDARLWRRMAELLRHPKGTAWLAADELVDGVVMAPHFGRKLKANGNMGKIVRLAASTGAQVVPVYSERTGGAHFISHILPPLDIPHTRLGPDAVLEQVARLDAVFAPIVRRHLDQWLWTVDLVSTAEDPIMPYECVPIVP